MARLNNTFERKLKAAGVYEPLSTLLSTDTPERALALGTGVKQYNTLADIPAGFSGTAQVGTQLYVGDGGAAVAVGGARKTIKTPYLLPFFPTTQSITYTQVGTLVTVTHPGTPLVWGQQYNGSNINLDISTGAAVAGLYSDFQFIYKGVAGGAPGSFTCVSPISANTSGSIVCDVNNFKNLVTIEQVDMSVGNIVEVTVDTMQMDAADVTGAGCRISIGTYNYDFDLGYVANVSENVTKSITVRFKILPFSPTQSTVYHMAGDLTPPGGTKIAINSSTVKIAMNHNSPVYNYLAYQAILNAQVVVYK